MWTDFPKPDEIDLKRKEKDLLLPAPPIQYVIFFTARSGSSWLTKVAEGTGKLSSPGEIFNPNFLPDMVRATNARSLREYRDIISRRRNTGGVFGFEITYHQLRAVFGDSEEFQKLFPTFTPIWLVRRDIVEQAVSLYKMQATQVAHTTETGKSEVERADLEFAYSARQIRGRVEHLLNCELDTEDYFERHGIEPLRMWYEQNMKLGPRIVANRIGEHIGIGIVSREEAGDNPHRKIGTSLNIQFAERFREEEHSYLTEVEEKRQRTLRGLELYKEQLARFARKALSETS